MQIDGLALHFLLLELRPYLLGGRLDKIQQPAADTLVITMQRRRGTYHLVICINPRQACLYLTAIPPANPGEQPAFCSLIRHHLEGGRLTALTQRGLDRIVDLTVDICGERGRLITKTLSAELMGKNSNVILVQDDVIVDAMRRVPLSRSRVRAVLPGTAYAPPPATAGVNPLQAPLEALRASLSSSTQDLTKTLIASTEGIGPYTAREIIFRAGLTPTAYPLTAPQVNAVIASMQQTIQPMTQGHLVPTVTVNLNGTAELVTPFAPQHLSDGQQRQFTTMNEAINWAVSLSPSLEQRERENLHKMVMREYDKLTRKAALIQQDLNNAADADAHRLAGDILMAHLHLLTKGQTAVTLPNIYQPATTITIALDPTMTGVENAQKYYHKYNKLKRSINVLTAQLTATREELTYLDSVMQSLDQAETETELLQIRQELIRSGYIHQRTGRRGQLLKVTPLTIELPEGWQIIIGKNNQQNDFVTFKLAQPDDLWFHVKNIPGSHVVVRCVAHDPPENVLLAAAQLAVWFSKARHSSHVPVEYTRRKHVKKPAGAKPGFVVYDRQRAMEITPDELLINDLLKK